MKMEKGYIQDYMAWRYAKPVTEISELEFNILVDKVYDIWAKNPYTNIHVDLKFEREKIEGDYVNYVRDFDIYTMTEREARDYYNNGGMWEYDNCEDIIHWLEDKGES